MAGLPAAPRWHGRFDAQRFLDRDWQRRPRLLRGALPGWHSPLSPGDLAALARDAEVESRLVCQERRQWRVEHGPFSRTRFARLPRRAWTLLVQAVDHHVPAVAALRDAFAFLPDWRIDDVMVSHAVRDGGVGPHYDQYDVFLVQGRGRRRWRVGPRCDARTPLRPHDSLRLLEDFTPRHDWVLAPGDVLYLPARQAHDGIALDDDCMTFSVGLRAPSVADLVGHWADHLLQLAREDERYTDGVLAADAPPGELDAATLARVRALMRDSLATGADFDDWFARLVSEPKYPREPPRDDPLDPAALRARLASGARLARHPASRLLLVATGRGVRLYVDGECHACTGAAATLARRLCARERTPLTAHDLRAASALELAATLEAAGALTWIEDRD